MTKHLKRNAIVLALFSCHFFLLGRISAQDSFDTIINLPGDPFIDSISDFEPIGSDQSTQVNVMDGGAIGNFVSVFRGSEINISGGTVGFRFDARSGSTANISGGHIGTGFEASTDSNVSLFGGEFTLNGTDFDGPNITLEEGDIFTCTLTDGSVLIFSEEQQGEEFVGVTLIPQALPLADQLPILVDSEFPDRPNSLRFGQQLTVEDGGFLPGNINSIDATISVNGGTLGVDEPGVELNLVRTVVNVNGGIVDYSNISALSGSEINISGGVVVPRSESVQSFSSVRAFSGGVINISGGAVETLNMRASGSGVINISGGNVRRVMASNGGTVNITGGTVGEDSLDIVALSGFVNLFGSDFVLDGRPLDELVPGNRTIVGGRDVILSGILEDGSEIFITLGSRRFRGIDPDSILTVTLIEPDEEPELTPTEAILDFEDVSGWMVINGNSDIGASDIANSGQTSLEVEGTGYTVVESPELSTDDLPLGSTNVSIDLFVGSDQPNPHWIGAMQLFIHAPSANIYNAYAGQVQLTGIDQDEFTTLTFNIPAHIANALAGSHDDVQLRYALNVNRDSGPYYLDNIQFGE